MLLLYHLDDINFTHRFPYSGAHRHGSLPISASSSTHRSGKRYNLVIWLFGEHGDVRIAPYEEQEQMNVIQRWHGCNNHTQRFAYN